MKDKQQKSKALRYSVSKRWFPQLEVDVQSTHGVSKSSPLMTDLDVLVSIPDDFVGYRHVVFDCKTLAKESPVNRTFWLRGVLDRMSADHGFCVLKKDAIEADHKLAAARLGIFLVAEDEFDVLANATSNQYGIKTGHTANIDAWDMLFAIKDRFSALEGAMAFARSGYWMHLEPAEACRKTVACVHEIRAELDPSKPEHLTFVCDLTALFGRALAILASFLFRAYLHPKSQHELEDAVKVLLYGGREAYEHRNQLYKLLRERNGGQIADDLALPEWGKFVQLVRQLLDAPGEAAKAPLILRELAFSILLRSEDIWFARLLCVESPQAGRFAVLLLSYLVRSARLPPEFGTILESKLMGMLDAGRS